MSPSRVTCVVTAYQYGRFIGRCLDSILAQDHPAGLLDVVVVDDGSTDDTPDVVARYGDAVRYVRQRNAGQIAATNRGIAEAVGDYIILVDADDTIPADRVSAQASILDARPEVGLVYGDMTIIDADDHTVRPTYHGSEPVTPYSGRVLGPLLLENFMPGGTMMFRVADRPVYHPIGPEASVQDWWIGTHLAVVSEIAYIDRPMNHYRLHGANDNLGASEERKLRLIANDLRFRRHVLGTFDLSAVASADLLAAWERYEAFLRHVCLNLREPVELHAPVAAGDLTRSGLHLARARIAADRGDTDGAIRSLIAALAADPFSAPAREEHATLLRGGGRPPLDTRAFVTMAHGEELLRDAGLLRGYARAFEAADDATLLIYVPSTDTGAEQRLQTLVAETGLDGAESPDMLVVYGPPDPAQHPVVPRRVHAVLTNGGTRAPGEVPAWGAGAIDALRRYADACLAPESS